MSKMMPKVLFPKTVQPIIISTTPKISLINLSVLPSFGFIIFIPPQFNMNAYSFAYSSLRAKTSTPVFFPRHTCGEGFILKGFTLKGTKGVRFRSARILSFSHLSSRGCLPVSDNIHKAHNDDVHCRCSCILTLFVLKSVHSFLTNGLTRSQKAFRGSLASKTTFPPESTLT